MKNNYEYLVSACLCGEKCRYDGKVFISEHIKQLVVEEKAIMVCPEVLGGMSVPRLPCEIKDDKVLNTNNENKTDRFMNGAKKVLELAKKYDITKAILKEKSPSCGSKYIYDGSFKRELIPGEGLTTKLLRENGIQVISDESFNKINQ